ncbi:hypothetical protein J7J00_01960 [Bacillus sp. ISL-4]|uniref:hypothetical protein n=1 Tax=Bacillus sp. ISL-4 TaxID=2819125 RepID=UPI001BEAF711|nr:hypothetical protein [Bacillus sp. ISL-4]MBT2664275.1 hypothetical protein [Bacillus sp. ISL-4]
MLSYLYIGKGCISGTLVLLGLIISVIMSVMRALIDFLLSMKAVRPEKESDQIKMTPVKGARTS